MAKKTSGKIVQEFKYEIDPNFDFVLEDGQNTSICLRKISWGDREPKIDIRKYMYQNGEELMRKGISLSDEATDEMVGILAEHGYGNTSRILKAIAARDDYDVAVNSLEQQDSELEDYDEDEYYDPSELIS